MKSIQTGTVWLPKDPNPKPRRSRPSRHCSRGRWARFPHLALRPHPSKHGSESASPHPVTCQKDVRRGVRRRHRSRVRRPRFPQLAFGPHPSRHGSESASPHPVHCQKDVRRRDRGQRPTATKDPNPKQPRRQPSRHRWTRGPTPSLAAITRRPNSHFVGLEIVIITEKRR